MGRRRTKTTTTSPFNSSGTPIAAASLTAGSLTAAFNYLVEREWPAVVFLTMAAFSTVWYGIIALVVVRAAFAF